MGCNIRRPRQRGRNPIPIFRLESYLYGPHGREEMADDRVCGHFDCHVGGDGCMIVDRGCTDSHTV
ncbi:MAG: hypothetical protein IIC93_10445 [Chloroflexi bacterium]|nr:hypothetical protein [Chloroflexota bacterium]